MALYTFTDIAPKIADVSFLAPSADIIGSVVIGKDTSVWYGCVLRGDVNHIEIGESCNIQDATVIHVATRGNPTILGDRVSVGHKALLHACCLESDSFVGMAACVMDGAVVESYGMLAAGALLTYGKRVPSGQLWGGAPARYMRDLTESDRELIRWTWLHYVNLGKMHAQSEMVVYGR